MIGNQSLTDARIFFNQAQRSRFTTTASAEEVVTLLLTYLPPHPLCLSRASSLSA